MNFLIYFDQAELLELKVSEEGAAQGVGLKHVDNSRGAVNVYPLYQNGTLNVGDFSSCWCILWSCSADGGQKMVSVLNQQVLQFLEILGLPAPRRVMKVLIRKR